jgi:hypothetical protein
VPAAAPRPQHGLGISPVVRIGALVGGVLAHVFKRRV